MPIRFTLALAFLPLAFATLAPPAMSAGLKPVARVALPCESYIQKISPAGDQVAAECMDHTLRLVNVSSGTTQHTFDDPQITAFTYSHDAHWFAVGLFDGSVEVVPTSGADAPRRWESSARAIVTLEFSPDSNAIVVGARDTPGQVWDLHGAPKQTATLHADFAGLIVSSFSPDGKVLATADGDTVIRFYDTATWKMIHEYRALLLETFAVAFISDGKHVAVGGPEDHITVLDAATGAEVQKVPKDPEVIRQILPFGNDGQAAVRYVDGDGKKPPHHVVWNMKTLKSVQLEVPAPLTGAGVVGTRLWVASAKGTSLEIWAYE